jgi:hypothetical protein
MAGVTAVEATIPARLPAAIEVTALLASVSAQPIMSK